MLTYILRRLVLLVPTFLGIIALNFFVIQSAPGGPVEQYLLRLEGADKAFMERIGAESSDSGGGMGGTQSFDAGTTDGLYKGNRGLSPEVVEEVSRMYGFDRPIHERFFLMLRNYLSFDFGDSFFKGRSVMQLLGDSLPVSVSLGVWSTLIIYMVSIPLGICRAVRQGTRFDAVTGTLVVIGDAIPGFLFAVLLIVLFAGGSYWSIFPLRGLVSPGFEQMTLWQQIADYFWHMALPLTALVIGGFATLTTLTRNSFLDEIHKQYTATALAKGLTMGQVLYRHVFRNAMLIVIAGFPSTFIHMFFTGSVLIEVIFSLNGLGLLGFEAAMTRDYPVMFATLYLFTLLGLLTRILSDITYSMVDPRITFGSRGVSRG
ncbi:microcin C ABC transporter permease YejB [Desulfovibrio psychrotolerans]|uniref:Microcin C ABC transporter permease YejB n=1 Tax=Desulfovibrio psychrotolerans TaxID=415242 RepID=A0A7J0BSV6_9BACT|nr:microcin C ABC transporter permease YejB [Desulfovibrio psychrotolerans]GFM36271.1 microcin C ABC transporter permease YejB [Desulfovibrio psychrotolerans]